MNLLREFYSNIEFNEYPLLNFAKFSLSSDVLLEFICFPSGGAFYLYCSVLNLECIVLKSEAAKEMAKRNSFSTSCKSFPHHTEDFNVHVPLKVFGRSKCIRYGIDFCYQFFCFLPSMIYRFDSLSCVNLLRYANILTFPILFSCPAVHILFDNALFYFFNHRPHSESPTGGIKLTMG
jgi:hypothetical protein